MEFKNKSQELGEGTYQCTLDEATLEKATLELNEDPEQRATQIERFRQWVNAKPHMSSRTDDGFLLRYLRIAKFDQEKAQQILDNYWTARTVPGRGAPEWFSNMDPADPENQELVEKAFCIPLPGRDHIGRKVVYINTGGYDPNVISLNEVFRVQLMKIDTLIQDEHTQVHGFVMLLDFSEFTASHVFGWSLDRIRKACRCLQETYPTRNKSINLYNTPTVFNALFDIFMYYVRDKMKERIHFHKDSLESLYREIDSRMLPNELGGTAGTKKELARQWKEEFLRNREELLRCSDPKYGIQEDKRPPSESGGAWGWGWTGLF